MILLCNIVRTCGDVVDDLHVGFVEHVLRLYFDLIESRVFCPQIIDTRNAVFLERV